MRKIVRKEEKMFIFSIFSMVLTLRSIGSQGNKAGSECPDITKPSLLGGPSFISFYMPECKHLWIFSCKSDGLFTICLILGVRLWPIDIHIDIVWLKCMVNF